MIEELAQMPGGLNVKRSTIVYKHMRDPALMRYYYGVKMLNLVDKLDISGSSPTDIFIGRFGYPKVFIGPLVPPEFGDTSILGTPEQWRDMSMESIVDMRSKLVRGVHLSNIHDVEKGRIEEQVRDLALAEKPAVADMSFSRKPSIKIALNDEVQPFGPTGEIKQVELYNIKAESKMEALYQDIDAKASTAILELYDKGLQVSKIQQGLSAGLFGIKNQRRFVPTRWSITAVDDTISKDLREEIKQNNPMDVIYAYYNIALDNRWLIFFMPGNWQYESIEAWYPKTIWNENGTDISIYSSYEGYHGRSTYAEIGGCYYAARLAVTEKLKKLGRQGTILILREVHDGYIMPVGVWNVREHVRQTLETEPTVLHGTKEMWDMIAKRLEIPKVNWIANSRILKDLITQRRIIEYVK
jgi:hypothetical protein